MPESGAGATGKPTSRSLGQPPRPAPPFFAPCIRPGFDTRVSGSVVASTAVALHHGPMTDTQPDLHPDHVADPALLGYALERLSRSRAPAASPLPPGNPALALSALPEHLPEAGLGAEAALELLAGPMLDGSAQLHHPGYFAHMDPPTAAVTWLAALWQAAANQNLLHPDAGPTARALERRLVGWLAPYFGMDGGHLVPGSTVANFTALWAARELRGVRRVLASERAHLSVRKSADILGLRYEAVPSDRRHRLQTTRLPVAGDGLGDAVVVATAGTVATGALDPLAIEGAAWLHVDAAWGGPLVFTERHANLLEGVERADSVGFSAHKWCYQPKGTAAILFRDSAAAHGAMSYGGGYLSAPNIGLLGSAPATALPFAASLLCWGRAGLAERIETGMAAAATFARLVEDGSRFELWGPPETGVVVWRPRTVSAAALRERLRGAWVSVTDIDGEVWLRAVAANPSADPRYVYERAVAALAS